MSYKQHLLDLINQENGTSCTLDQVRFNPPLPRTATEQNTRNTKVSCFGIRAGGLEGLYNFTYDRVDLALLFSDREAHAVVPGSFYSMEDVLSSLSERYGLTLYADDFTSPDMGPDSQVITLIPNADNFYWLGSALTVTISYSLIDIGPTLPHVELPGFEYPEIFPRPIDISQGITVTELPGFEYPTINPR